MAPRRGQMGEMTGPTEPSPEVTYPILGINEEPLAFMQAPLVINGIYLLCTVSLMIAYWKFIQCREKRVIFYLLPFALLFISASTIFNILTGTLLLGDPNVRQTYNLMRGFFTLCYYLGKVALVEVIFAILHNRIGAFTPEKTPKHVLVVTYLDRVFISIMFFVVITITGFTIQYSIDSNDLYRSKAGITYQKPVLGYQEHWDRITLAYNCMLLVAGLHSACFSAYLLNHANKKGQDKKEIGVLLAMVSPSMVANGLFFVIIDSISFHVGIMCPWSFIYLAQTIIDAVTLTCAFTGVVWVGIKREKWVPGITEAGIASHLQDIPLKEPRR